MKHIQDRYEVRPSGSRFIVWDHTLRAACGFGGPAFRWATREDAWRWLVTCYSTWGTNPATGEDPPPQKSWGAQRYNPRQPWSPWREYTTPLAADERPFWSA